MLIKNNVESLGYILQNLINKDENYFKINTVTKTLLIQYLIKNSILQKKSYA